jgi:hypothetical protein
MEFDTMENGVFSIWGCTAEVTRNVAQRVEVLHSM